MIICFDCSPETKKTLDALIETGQYKDYAEVISVAIANQVILQSQIANKGALVIEGDSISQFKPSGVTGNSIKESVNSPLLQTPKNEDLKAGDRAAIKIPPIFRLDGLTDSSPLISQLPSDFWVPGQEIPLDRWLFGQYNKLLPAKANCRALAHLLLSEPKGVALDDATLKITSEAAVLGDYLRQCDALNGNGRDDALSTAFPSSNDKSSKGWSRYANQFIASVNKQGQMSGLLIELKLINYKPSKKPRLHLTDIGWQLSTLHNPILDGTQDSQAQKFTDEEISLLLDHISNNVPVEDFAYRAVLTAIVEGANSPERIDEFLQRYVSEEKTREVSSSFLSSQRSGAVSRMADLGLVERVRDGVRVSYLVTKRGRQYVEKSR